MTDLAYSVERTFPVDTDTMWSAWTQASALEQWYAPTELNVVAGSVVSEAIEGGRWAVAVDAAASSAVRGTGQAETSGAIVGAAERFATAAASEITATAGKASAGTITRAQLAEIAQAKMKDLNANDIDAATKIIEGSARAMGLTVVEG